MIFIFFPPVYGLRGGFDLGDFFAQGFFDVHVAGVGNQQCADQDVGDSSARVSALCLASFRP